jgi:hypothetical protein
VSRWSAPAACNDADVIEVRAAASASRCGSCRRASTPSPARVSPRQAATLVFSAPLESGDYRSCAPCRGTG